MILSRLKAGRKAGVPLVSITTPDQPALIQMIRSGFNGAAPPILAWDCATALQGLNDEGRAALASLYADPMELFNLPLMLGTLQSAPERTLILVSMVDRLVPAPDGKPKVFRNSLVGGFKDFLGSFDARNITGDAELAVLVQRASQLLSGVDADGLRASETTRTHIGAQMASIKATLDTMMIDRPVRRYGADDAE